MAMDPNTFAQSLKAARTRLGLSQEKLAQLSDVGIAVVRKYEQGGAKQPAAGMLLRLSKALGCSIEYLLTGSEYAPSVGAAAPADPAYLEFAASPDGKRASQADLAACRSLAVGEGRRPTVEMFKRLLFSLQAADVDDQGGAAGNPGWSAWPQLLAALGPRPNVAHLRLLAQLRPGKGYTPELADLLEWYAMLDQGFPPESLADSLATAEAGAREFAESGLARPDDLEESGGWSHK